MSDPAVSGADPSGEMRWHYEDAQVEADRLSCGVGRMEAARTLEIFHRHAPAPPAVVLDVGGGAGVYALPLAREGYALHLLDAVPRHVEQARAASAQQPSHPLASAALGDARGLAQPDGFADVVLLLGPLYHLTERDDRLTALRETRRVLRPGGLLLAAAISRFASAFDGLRGGYLDDPAFAAIVDRDLRDGQHRNPGRQPAYFTTAYLHRPEELADEIGEAGLQHRMTAGVEGPAWLLPDFDGHWNEPARRERLMDVARRLEAEPSLLGVSAHLLAVASRPT